MTKEVASCKEDEAARAAAERMLQSHVGSLPVVDGEGRLTGVVTDRDLVVRVMARGLDANAATLSEVMSRELVTCAPTDDVDEAVDRMMRHQVRRIYIVDADGRLAGVIAQADIASRSGNRSNTARLVERVSQPGVPEPVPFGMGSNRE